jgi:hypothetical protein
MAANEKSLADEDRIMRVCRVYHRLVAHGLPRDNATAFSYGQDGTLTLSLETAEALADRLDKLEGAR